MITTVQSLFCLYGVWVALNGAALWLLARLSARGPLHYGVLVVAAIVTVICVASLLYALAINSVPPRSAIQIFLNQKGTPLLIVSFLVWPFLACAAVAHLSRRLSLAPQATQWLSFGCGSLIALLSPFALLAAGCGLAGACF